MKFALLTPLFLLSACASINSVSLTPIPPQRQQKIEAQVSKTIFLGFNFNNDFIDPLVEDLKAQCPGGLVSGVLTKDETISYVFVFIKRVTATGYCVRTASATAATPSAPAPRQRTPRQGPRQ